MAIDTAHWRPDLAWLIRHTTKQGLRVWLTLGYLYPYTTARTIPSVTCIALTITQVADEDGSMGCKIPQRLTDWHWRRTQCRTLATVSPRCPVNIERTATRAKYGDDQLQPRERRFINHSHHQVPVTTGRWRVTSSLALWSCLLLAFEPARSSQHNSHACEGTFPLINARFQHEFASNTRGKWNGIYATTYRSVEYKWLTLTSIGPDKPSPEKDKAMYTRMGLLERLLSPISLKCRLFLSKRSHYGL